MIARFNERFILSLGSCADCLVLDDELNVLPISKGKDTTPIEKERGKGKVESGFKDLQESLADTKPVGELVKLAKTLDQAQAILTVVDAIAEKTLSSTVHSLLPVNEESLQHLVLPSLLRSHMGIRISSLRVPVPTT